MGAGSHVLFGVTVPSPEMFGVVVLIVRDAQHPDMSIGRHPGTYPSFMDIRCFMAAAVPKVNAELHERKAILEQTLAEVCVLFPVFFGVHGQVK